MQVRLTEKGRQALGFSPDRIIASVSDNRAFVMMQNGMANPDKGFMILFDGKVDGTVEKSKEDRQKPKLKPKSKREKAMSKKAAKRETAIKQ